MLENQINVETLLIKSKDLSVSDNVLYSLLKYREIAGKETGNQIHYKSPEITIINSFLLGVSSSLLAAILYSIGSIAFDRLLKVIRGECNPKELNQINILSEEIAKIEKLLKDQTNRQSLIEKMKSEYAHHEILIQKKKEETYLIFERILDNLSQTIYNSTDINIKD